MSGGVTGHRWRSTRRALVAVLVPVVLTGCALVQVGTTNEPSSSPAPTASGPAADPSRSPAPTAAPSTSPPPGPSVGIPNLSLPPSTTLASTTAPTGLRTSTSTVRGRSGSARWTVTIPVFSGAPVSTEVNRRVRAAVDDLVAQVRREARDDAGVRRTLTGQGEVVTNDGRTAQVTIQFDDYQQGTAHPTDYWTTTVVDVRRARPVLFSSVVQNPPEAMRFLRTEVVVAARREGHDVDPDGLSPKLSNWSAWQSTPEGLRFLFGDYQLGGHGLRSYTVPWPRAKLVLSDYGLRLLAP